MLVRPLALATLTLGLRGMPDLVAGLLVVGLPLLSSNWRSREYRHAALAGSALAGVLIAYPVVSFLILGAIAQFGSVLYLTILIFTGTRLAEMFRQRKALTVGANTTVGIAFLIFAVKMSVAA